MDERLKILNEIINNAKSSLDQAQKLLDQLVDAGLPAGEANYQINETEVEETQMSGSIIEGVFDGTHMIGPDGRRYEVPVNYASKSKLVEGDILKLTIKFDGTFIYKPIKPIDRQRLNAILVKDEETGEFRALVDNQLYKLLLASVTYFKGRVGDRVVILIPATSPSTWAAVENIVPKVVSVE